MMRKQLSMEDLVSIINDGIKNSDLLDGDCKECYISGLLPLAGPDADGCNWALSIYTGPPECKSVIAEIVSPLRALYNLSG